MKINIHNIRLSINAPTFVFSVFAVVCFAASNCFDTNAHSNHLANVSTFYHSANNIAANSVSDASNNAANISSLTESHYTF